MDTAIQHSRDTSVALPTGGDRGLGERLAAHYAHRIAQRQLQPGARLPSVRDCARAHSVSPSTVVAAYDRLQAQGLIEARRQRGFYVRPAAAAGHGAAAARAQPRVAGASGHHGADPRDVPHACLVAGPGPGHPA